MKKTKNQNKPESNWVLLNRKRKVLYRSNNVADVFRKGQECPYGAVIIEQRFKPGTCFF
ncbi:MAG: hypothetical protein V1726_01070 [Methanobacteriota archaeon]